MKGRSRLIISFVLAMTSAVYLLWNLVDGGIIHALSEKSSITQEMRQNQMSLELTVVEGQTFKQGEPIELVGKIKNVSDKAVVIREPVDDWTLRVYIEFKPESGFQEMQPNRFVSTVGPSLITLKPSEEHTFFAVFTPTFYSMPEAGKYHVYMKYGSPPKNDRSVWSGDVKSPVITISIIE